MTRLIWDEVGSRTYEFGVEKGVFYPSGGPGVAWNGLLSVKEAPSSSSKNTRYFDGQKYQASTTPESFSGTIEALTYPHEFEEYDGSASVQSSYQKRRPFGLSYVTKVRNDLGQEFTNIHLIYNVLVETTERSYLTLTDDVDPTTFSWDFTTLPVEVPSAKPAGRVIIRGLNTNAQVIGGLEMLLYGSDTEQPRLPLPYEVMDVMEEHAVVKIIDHGDGTWTAIGPDDMVSMLDTTTFSITSPTASYITADMYKISSY